MREFRTYGSMRGALGNGRPYRDQRCPVPHGELLAEAGRSGRGGEAPNLGALEDTMTTEQMIHVSLAIGMCY